VSETTSADLLAWLDEGRALIERLPPDSRQPVPPPEPEKPGELVRSGTADRVIARIDGLVHRVDEQNPQREWVIDHGGRTIKGFDLKLRYRRGEAWMNYTPPFRQRNIMQVLGEAWKRDLIAFVAGYLDAAFLLRSDLSVSEPPERKRFPSIPPGEWVDLRLLTSGSSLTRYVVLEVNEEEVASVPWVERPWNEITFLVGARLRDISAPGEGDEWRDFSWEAWE